MVTHRICILVDFKEGISVFAVMITSMPTGFVNTEGRVSAISHLHQIMLHMFWLSVPRTLGPAVCRIAAHDSRLRPRPPLSPATLQPTPGGRC